jgi:hypothetical protein
MLTSQTPGADLHRPAGRPRLASVRTSPNYLGALNPWTGHISRVPVTGPSLEPQGMIFIGRAARR